MAIVAHALTTLDRIKDFLGITGSTSDTILERLINSASDFIEKEVGGRRFKLTAYTNEEYDGSGTSILNLRNWPVSSTATTTLQFRETLENVAQWQTIQSKDYKIDLISGQLKFIQGTLFSDIPLHYRVSFTAGFDYDNVATFLSDIGEGDLEYACWILVRDYFNKKGKSGDIQSESIGNYSVTFNLVIRRDQEMQDIIRKYSRPMVF